MYHFADRIRGESVFSVGDSRSRWKSDQLPPQSNRLRKDAEVEEGITYYYFEISNQNININARTWILFVSLLKPDFLEPGVENPWKKMKSEAIWWIFSHEFLWGAWKILKSGTISFMFAQVFLWDTPLSRMITYDGSGKCSPRSVPILQAAMRAQRAGQNWYLVKIDKLGKEGWYSDKLRYAVRDDGPPVSSRLVWLNLSRLEGTIQSVILFATVRTICISNSVGGHALVKAINLTLSGSSFPCMDTGSHFMQVLT